MQACCVSFSTTVWLVGVKVFQIGIRSENISKMIVVYVILTVYRENSITNNACVPKISILHKTRNNPLYPHGKNR